MSIIEERLRALNELMLGCGGHGDWEHGACVMEAVSYVAGEPFTDHPQCASPVITSFLISLNDRLDDEDRQLLKPYITRLVGTNTGRDEDERTRRYMLLDWLAHEALPGLLRKADLPELAEELEQLVAVTDPPTAEAARAAIRRTRDATWDKRQAWRVELRRRIELELRKRGAAAVAAAAAAAVADAAAAVDRRAVRCLHQQPLVLDAVAVAAADADAGGWNAVYDAVYAAVKPIYIEKFGEINRGLLTSALKLIDRLIEVGATVDEIEPSIDERGCFVK